MSFVANLPRRVQRVSLSNQGAREKLKVTRMFTHLQKCLTCNVTIPVLTTASVSNSCVISVHSGDLPFVVKCNTLM